MVREITENEIKKFIAFGDSVYASDPDYVPFMRRALAGELKKLVFRDRTYKALCSFDEQGRINGRVLLTLAHSKQLHSDRCGYFSHFEIVNDRDVFAELMDRALSELKAMGAEYVVGPFYPHDPDNRRGFVVDGFTYPPMLFTSHNPAYYPVLFENAGFAKLTDTLEYEYSSNEETEEKIRRLAERAAKRYDFRIDKLDPKQIDRDVEAARTIMEAATTQIHFEDVLPADEFRKIFKEWSTFVDPDFALLARRNSDDQPIGFTFSIPDYAELIRKMKGRLGLRGLLIFVFGKKHIKGIRGVLQYVVPEYQSRGVAAALYNQTCISYKQQHKQRATLGTCMENNDAANRANVALGGKLSRRYRVYYKNLE